MSRAGIVIGLFTIAFVGACARPECPALSKRRPASDQPYGGACELDADCQQGFTCLPQSLESGPTKICSLPCDQGCPEMRSHCDADLNVCIPTCATDADCVKGANVGRCVVPQDSPGGYCQPIACNESYACPSGAECVGQVCTRTSDGVSVASGWCEALSADGGTDSGT